MKKGKQTYVFENVRPKIVGRYSIVGPKEGEGSIPEYFDKVLDDDLIGQKTFEIAESKMLHKTIEGAVERAGLKMEDVDLLMSGDLLNQTFASNFAARELDVPFAGLYGACSSFGEGLALASLLIDGGAMEKIAVASSSHFSSAERQYRFPLELGNQRTPTSQWTVTGAGCSVLAASGEGASIVSATIGKVIDYDVSDVNNMGAAMAPAAGDTLLAHLSDLGIEPDYYDMIFTGDLGRHGMEMFRYFMEQSGVKIGDNYCDCGAMIFRPEQRTFQGGSGAGCSSAVFNAYILELMMRGRWKRVLLMPTGALLSKDSPLQGEPIPAICHAISVEMTENSAK